MVLGETVWGVGLGRGGWWLGQSGWWGPDWAGRIAIVYKTAKLPRAVCIVSENRQVGLQHEHERR